MADGSFQSPGLSVEPRMLPLIIGFMDTPAIWPLLHAFDIAELVAAARQEPWMN